MECMVRPLKMAVLSLSVYPLLELCLLSQLIWLTFLPTCPRPHLVTVLIKGAVRGRPLCWFPWEPMSQPDINSPNNWLFPLPTQQEGACRQVLPTICLPVRSNSRTLLETCRLSHPLNHWHLCHWVETLSLSLKTIWLCCVACEIFSSPTRNWTWTPSLKAQGPNHCTLRGNFPLSSALKLASAVPAGPRGAAQHIFSLLLKSMS